LSIFRFKIGKSTEFLKPFIKKEAVRNAFRKITTN